MKSPNFEAFGNDVLCADALMMMDSGSSCDTQVVALHDDLPELPEDLVMKCLSYMPKFKMVGLVPCLNKFWKEFVETGGISEQYRHHGGENFKSCFGFLMYEMGFSKDFILQLCTLEHESFRWEQAPPLRLRQSRYVGMRDIGILECASDGYLMASIWTSDVITETTLTAFYVWNPLRPNSPHEVNLQSPEMGSDQLTILVDAHLAVDKESTPPTFKVVMFNEDAKNGGWIYSSSTHQWTTPEANIYPIFENTGIERLDLNDTRALRVSTGGCIYIAAQNDDNPVEFGVLCFDTRNCTWTPMMILNHVGSTVVASQPIIVRFTEALVLLPGPTLYMIVRYETQSPTTFVYSERRGVWTTVPRKQSQVRHIWALDLGQPAGPAPPRWNYVGCGPEGLNCRVGRKIVKWYACVVKGAHYICALVSARNIVQPKDVAILMYNIERNTWTNVGLADSCRVLPPAWKTMFEHNRFLPNFYPSWV